VLEEVEEVELVPVFRELAVLGPPGSWSYSHFEGKTPS
jgi:hypothetical protein